ncbi:MAG: 3-hydroxyacyl-CoA dehydrogenase NAD-binding domain-containing protein, partial [Gammaproteobacteria bacterium]|nr:3-hydroxyacyl-CoA dehydrogenase NAD-binding domain-containing protein [Gammaproteobacteria bacterium]
MSAGANNQSIVVFGAGSWGTALAVVLARNGYDVLLWARQREHVERMRRERQNSRFLPEVSFPQSLVITDNLIEASTVGDKWL